MKSRQEIQQLSKTLVHLPVNVVQLHRLSRCRRHDIIEFESLLHQLLSTHGGPRLSYSTVLMIRPVIYFHSISNPILLIHLFPCFPLATFPVSSSISCILVCDTTSPLLIFSSLDHVSII